VRKIENSGNGCGRSAVVVLDPDQNGCAQMGRYPISSALLIIEWAAFEDFSLRKGADPPLPGAGEACGNAGHHQAEITR